LILHERNEGRDDDRELTGQNGGSLETERLAAAGRQHDEAVARVEDGVHRVALQWAEI
jgi:hypothetical protein